MYKTIKNVYKIGLWRDHFETCNIWAKRKSLSVVIKILSPMCCLPLPKGLYAPAPELYTCIKPLKMYIKSDCEEIILKLATYGQREKAFLLTSKFCPQGVVPGLYTCIKSFKMCLKSYFKEIVLKLATNGQSDKVFCWHQHLSPGGCLPLPWGYIHV